MDDLVQHLRIQQESWESNFGTECSDEYLFGLAADRIVALEAELRTMQEWRRQDIETFHAQRARIDALEAERDRLLGRIALMEDFFRAAEARRAAGSTDSSTP